MLRLPLLPPAGQKANQRWLFPAWRALVAAPRRTSSWPSASRYEEPGRSPLRGSACTIFATAIDRLRCRALWLPFLNAGFTGVRHYSKAIALCLAASLALVECCSARSPAQSRSHVTGVASALPTPQVAEEGYIWGTHWNPDEGAPGFEVLTEYPPLVTDAAGTSGSSYLGRVSDAFYFRNDAGELSFAQVTGGPRTVVARGVPKAVLLTGRRQRRKKERSPPKSSRPFRQNGWPNSGYWGIDRIRACRATDDGPGEARRSVRVRADGSDPGHRLSGSRVGAQACQRQATTLSTSRANRDARKPDLKDPVARDSRSLPCTVESRRTRMRRRRAHRRPRSSPPTHEFFASPKPWSCRRKERAGPCP